MYPLTHPLTHIPRLSTTPTAAASYAVASTTTAASSRRALHMLHTSPLAGKPPSELTVAVAGATGYIGKAVVRECVRRGYKTKVRRRQSCG